MWTYGVPVMNVEARLYAAVDHINNMCNKYVGPTMLLWEYRPTRDKLEFTYYFKYKGRNARGDYDIDLTQEQWSEDDFQTFHEELLDHEDELWEHRV